MKITKYEHACVVLEEQGKKLVIDPGNLTSFFGTLNDVVGMVITHVHADHFDLKHIQQILETNPQTKTFTTAEVAQQLQGPNTNTPQAGDTAQVGPLDLTFFGGVHAEVHPRFPRNQNIGVLINKRFYYPGDSFALPDTSVEVLALPCGGSWLKLREVIDFLQTIKPAQCFPTHDAHLSDRGRTVAAKWLMQVCEAEGITFTTLQPGQSLRI